MSDLQIIHKRKMGYSPLEIYKYYQDCEPCLDDLICLAHVVQVCEKAGLPFGKIQVKKVFNKLYRLEFHGSKTDYWNFIAKHCTNKVLVFKTEQSHVKKLPVDPPFSEKEAYSIAFSDSISSDRGNALEGLEMGVSQ
jgi:hypothetical protein